MVQLLPLSTLYLLLCFVKILSDLPFCCWLIDVLLEKMRPLNECFDTTSSTVIRKKLFWFNVKFWYFCQGIVPLGFCDIQCIAELGHVHALQITGSELSVCCITLHPISLIGLSDCVCLFSESRLLLIVLQIRSWWYFEQDVGRWYCFLLALAVWCFDFINKDLVMCVSFSAFLTLLV